jgi:hypothetical protein
MKLEIGLLVKRREWNGFCEIKYIDNENNSVGVIRDGLLFWYSIYPFDSYPFDQWIVKGPKFRCLRTEIS